MNIFEERNTMVFNSPLEIGLRSLYILSESYPLGYDLQRLIYYDYLLLHSNDINNGPESIHPSLPYRSTEILIKRDLIQKGIILMSSKDLVKPIFNEKGIQYSATDITNRFLEYNTSEYAKSLKRVSQWVIATFNSYEDKNLSIFMTNNLINWGGEFTKESIFRGGVNEK